MSVYAVAQLSFRDREAYARYQARFMDVLMKSRGGRLLVADEAPQRLEGCWQADKLVVISFPDEAAFREWNESPEYQEIAKDRKAGADTVALLARGIA